LSQYVGGDRYVIPDVYARPVVSAKVRVTSISERLDRVGCSRTLKPTALHFLILTVADWLQRRREESIAYLLAENAVYKEHFAKRGLRLTDAQRRRLAVKGKAVGRAGLRQIATIDSPDTMLRWYRQLVAQKYDGKARSACKAPYAAAL
jgi:hypothetical protein